MQVPLLQNAEKHQLLSFFFLLDRAFAAEVEKEGEEGEEVKEGKEGGNSEREGGMEDEDRRGGEVGVADLGGGGEDKAMGVKVLML